MTTPAEQTEQMFFYGEAIDQEPVSALALLGYADLTAGSAVIFEVVTIAVFVFTYWKDLCPWSSAMLKALIKAIYAVVTSDGVGKQIVNKCIGRLILAIIDLHIPLICPLEGIIRVPISLLCGFLLYTSLWFPAYWQVSGLLNAMISSNQKRSLYCMDDYRLSEDEVRLKGTEAHRSLQEKYCLGERRG
ncbi:hypothetical protein BDV29DRAFT_159728 [Aspergillus leporis]|uniref:Uncharacterized protein n=1 Tax=Aspergillus leporis TaxID=41062 RepID=A0A5N5WRH9_9EURO|nr:hypothetical protein BDV29DRAFT_159728 [Aspergillus leporis]